MKRWYLCLFIVLILLSACTKKMNMDNVVDQANFSGIIDEVNEKSILVRVNEGEEEIRSSDLISVSLDVELKDSMAHFKVGDEIRVYYDGNIAESYPAQINKVYAIIAIDQSKE